MLLQTALSGSLIHFHVLTFFRDRFHRRKSVSNRHLSVLIFNDLNTFLLGFSSTNRFSKDSILFIKINSIFPFPFVVTRRDALLVKRKDCKVWIQRRIQGRCTCVRGIRCGRGIIKILHMDLLSVRKDFKDLSHPPLFGFERFGKH